MPGWNALPPGERLAVFRKVFRGVLGEARAVDAIQIDSFPEPGGEGFTRFDRFWHSIANDAHRMPTGLAREDSPGFTAWVTGFRQSTLDEWKPHAIHGMAEFHAVGGLSKQ